MKLTKSLSFLILLALMAASARAELKLDGFLQGLYGGRLDEKNPTATEQTASETRLQLRLEDFSSKGEVFGRIDLTYDAADTVRYDWELREGYLKFRLGDNLDFKVGRQVLTWGTGDLIFINDVFAKDYRSFFVGRDDQYLKAPQNALRAEYYHSSSSLSLVWSPRFEANRLPTGRILSYYNPMAGGIVGEGYYFEPTLPEARFKNSELAARFQRGVGNFTAAVYLYHGFYKNPLGFDTTSMMAIYPRLNLYGASIRGAVFGGVLWLEGGYYDSYDDRDGNDPFLPNSSVTGMVGFERQVASDLTINGQWQLDYLTDYDSFRSGALMTNQPGTFIRDEFRHLLTSRITRKFSMETIIFSGFIFYSPSDEDLYLRLGVDYKYTDELTLAAGANIFDGNHPNTDFGQFAKNDNLYLKLTYGF